MRRLKEPLKLSENENVTTESEMMKIIVVVADLNVTKLFLSLKFEHRFQVMLTIDDN